MTLVSQPATQAQDADCFRALIRRQASSVTVVTAPGLPPAWLTATEFTSVSLRPPVVSFCLSRDASNWPTVARADHVAVHLLTDNHRNVAEWFGPGGIDRFTTSTTWTPGPHGVPILDNALGWLLCRVIERVVVGDRAVVLAEPLPPRQRAPLLCQDGRYACLLP